MDLPKTSQFHDVFLSSDEVLAANDELGQVFDKYIAVIVLGQPPDKTKSSGNNGSSLLDLSASNDIDLSSSVTLPKENKKESESTPKNAQTDLEMLDDIFSSLEATTATTNQNTNSLLSDTSIMQPVSISPLVPKGSLFATDYLVPR